MKSLLLAAASLSALCGLALPNAHAENVNTDALIRMVIATGHVVEKCLAERDIMRRAGTLGSPSSVNHLS